MNLKFKDFKYKRPDINLLQNKFEFLLDDFNNAGNSDEQYDILIKINELRKEFDSMQSIAFIRYSINTKDEFYADERDFFDKIMPEYFGLLNKLYQSLVKSKYRSELGLRSGKQLFDLAKVSVKTFSPEIIEELKSENKLVTEYVKLIASAKIMFEGEDRNLAGMGTFMQSENRKLRKSANEAKWKFFENNEKEFDRIYDELVKVRTSIAKKLGYKNFVELGYDRLKRAGYNWNEVKDFRNNVKDFIVPVSNLIKEKQKERLGIETLYYYDSEFDFKSGNPTPKGSAEWITGKAKKMYDELSVETKTFFEFMTDSELLDLENKIGKAAGGYCSFIAEYESPFIFSNMNGTSHDVIVLTHEAGHAFQVYESRHFVIPEYISPSLEACEIHSMSMEFITWPWMELFFEEDTDKYLYSHLSNRLLFIPYGVTVDEFQHWIYENPEATPDERKKMWRETENKYMPYKNYEENDFLNRGGWWMHQKHIFTFPFYYIDYCLAQVCALQFWRKCNNGRNIAWEDYLNLCKAGGSKPFLELLKVAKIESPFDKKSVESIISYCENWLESVSKNY